LKRKIPVGSRWIREELIYPHQIRVGARVMQQLLCNMSSRIDPVTMRTPLVILQPQGGKHGICTEVIERFITHCVKHNLRYQIIFMSGLSACSNKGQTIRRIVAESGLCARAKRTGLASYGQHEDETGIRILNCSTTMRSYDFNDPTVDVRLWILDECHIGNITDGCIDLMLKNHGVYQNEPCWKWGNRSGTRNILLNVSATPYAHEPKGDFMQGPKTRDDDLYKIIYDPPGPGYNSLENMRKSGRLRPAVSLPKRLTSGRFVHAEHFEQMYDTFLLDCKRDGPGYLVVRATGRQRKDLIAYLKRRERRRKYREFDASANNLNQLNGEFGIAPAEPEVLVIRGGQRAGMTIPRRNYIRGWRETETTANVDTVVQSGPGRACGHGRENDKYPIYCNLERIDEAIQHYAELEQGAYTDMPAGIGSKRLKGSRVCWQPEEWFAPPDAKAKAQASKYVKPFANLRDKAKGGPGGRKSIHTVSENVYNDCAGLFLRGGRDNNNTAGYWLDGPTTVESKKRYIREYSRDNPEVPLARVRKMADGYFVRNHVSWRDLKKRFPHLIGYAVCYALTPTRVGQDPEPDFRNAMQRPKSAVRRDGKSRRRAPTVSKTKARKTKTLVQRPRKRS
jgi:hypothetical protein